MCLSPWLCQYENTHRIQYGEGGPVFIPVCIECHRFVKADEVVYWSEDCGLKPGPNATCSKCGRTEMHFDGFF